MTVTSIKSCRSSVLLLLVLLLLCVSGLSGKEIKSFITDANGQSLQGATITDGHKAAFSRNDGSFTIVSNADSLSVSRLGYLTRKLSASNIPNPIMLQTSDIVLAKIRVTALENRGSTPALDSHYIFPDTNGKSGSTGDLLLSYSSLSSSDTQLVGERQTVSLLGSFSRHSLVMLDGVPLNPAGEAFDFNKIPFSQISHIEIIKGGSSVYGGSAAIGGIINIHTKSPAAKQRLEASQGFALGSFGMHKEQYFASLTKGLWSLASEYSHYDADNDFGYDTPDWWGLDSSLKRKHNRKVSDSFYLKSNGACADFLGEYLLNYGSFVRELPGPINFLDLYNDSHLSGANLYQSFKLTRVFSKFTQDLSLWLNSDSSIYRNLASNNPINPSHYSQDQSNSGIKSQSVLILPMLKLDLNLEHSRQDYSFSQFSPSASQSDGSRENTGIALRAERKITFPWLDYTISGAGRMDWGAGESHPSYRIEQQLVIPWMAELKLGGTVGTGYALPSLYDMYWMGDSETMGNPLLKSETSFGSSVWGSLNHPFYTLKAAYYYSRIEDLIQWRQTYLFGITWKPFNIGKAQLRNWELEMELKPYKYLSLAGSITLTDARDLSQNADGSHSSTYNKRLTYTPENRLQVTCKLADESRGMHLRINHSGRQYSTPDNLIDPLPAFSSLDAGAFWKLSRGPWSLVLDLKANNLLDKRYEIYAWVPQPGFNWSANSLLSLKI